MKSIEDTANEEVRSSIQQGLKDASNNCYFPSDFSNYLLGLKISQNLPVSLLPDNLFERPTLRGKKDYYHRLASELISFGLSYQRVYLKSVSLSAISSLFHAHKPWWKCDIQDIEKSLSILKDNQIIQEDEDGFIFEPFSISSDIRTFEPSS